MVSLTSVLRGLTGLALVAAAAGAPRPAVAQAPNYKLPSIGIEYDGDCKRFAVQERTSKAMLPLGCLDVASKTWKLTPGEVRQEGPNSYTPATPLYSAVNLQGEVSAGRFGVPNFTLSAPSWAFRYNSGADFGNTTPVSGQRILRCSTASDYKIYESCDNVDFYSDKGYVEAWAPNQAYSVGTLRRANDNVYVVTTPGTSASSGSGPSGTGSGIADGSVTWKFDGSYFLAAKSGYSMTAFATGNSGKIWAMNPNLFLGDGFKSQGYGMELDVTNFSGHDATLANDPYPGVKGLWISGHYGNTGLVGIGVGGFTDNPGKPMWQYGFWCENALAAKQTCMEDWSNSYAGFHTSSFAQKQYDVWAQSTSEVSFYANGNNRVAGFSAESTAASGYLAKGSYPFGAFQDVSNSPMSLLIQGIHSTAAYNDRSTTPTSVKTEGTYSYSAIDLSTAKGSGSTYGLTLAEGQRICFTGQDGCFRKSGGKLYYSSGGVDLFSIADGSGNAIFKGSVTPGQTP